MCYILIVSFGPRPNESLKLTVALWRPDENRQPVPVFSPKRIHPTAKSGLRIPLKWFFPKEYHRYIESKCPILRSRKMYLSLKSLFERAFITIGHNSVLAKGYKTLPENVAGVARQDEDFGKIEYDIEDLPPSPISPYMQTLETTKATKTTDPTKTTETTKAMKTTKTWIPKNLKIATK